MKDYIKPEIEIQIVETLTMIAGSIPVGGDGEKADGSEVESKVINFADDASADF